MNDIPEARKELERAREALASAQLLLQGGLLVDTLSRAYYAVLHAAKAALLAIEMRRYHEKVYITVFDRNTNKSILPRIFTDSHGFNKPKFYSF